MRAASERVETDCAWAVRWIGRPSVFAWLPLFVLWGSAQHLHSICTGDAPRSGKEHSRGMEEKARTPSKPCQSRAAGRQQRVTLDKLTGGRHGVRVGNQNSARICRISQRTSEAEDTAAVVLVLW